MTNFEIRTVVGEKITAKDIAQVDRDEVFITLYDDKGDIVGLLPTRQVSSIGRLGAEASSDHVTLAHQILDKALTDVERRAVREAEDDGSRLAVKRAIASIREDLEPVKAGAVT